MAAAHKVVAAAGHAEVVADKPVATAWQDAVAAADQLQAWNLDGQNAWYGPVVRHHFTDQTVFALPCAVTCQQLLPVAALAS